MYKLNMMSNKNKVTMVIKLNNYKVKKCNAEQ